MYYCSMVIWCIFRCRSPDLYRHNKQENETTKESTNKQQQKKLVLCVQSSQRLYSPCCWSDYYDKRVGIKCHFQHTMHCMPIVHTLVSCAHFTIDNGTNRRKTTMKDDNNLFDWQSTLNGNSICTIHTAHNIRICKLFNQ